MNKLSSICKLKQIKPNTIPKILLWHWNSQHLPDFHDAAQNSASAGQ